MLMGKKSHFSNHRYLETYFLSIRVKVLFSNDQDCIFTEKQSIQIKR